MHVRRLELADFRSYEKLAIEFDTGPSVLVGPNGEGKTNLIEALGYVATLGSHRVATDGPLVRSGAERAVVRTAIAHESRELLVELEIVPGKANRARLNRAPATRPRDVLGALRMVLFAPEDLALVRGDPAERRRFLDELLVARQPRYAGVRADYERVVKQRNALLRTAYLSRKAGAGSRDLSTLDVWDNHLAQHGAELLAGRLELVDSLRDPIGVAYEAVSRGKSRAYVEYQSSLGDDLTGADRGVLTARLLEALAAARSSEIERGVTLVGPHRDELRLTLGDLPVKGYASHGEYWSFALGLRLASFQLLRDEGVEPVLALDDVFAELDTDRRERLAAMVADAGQTLVTCAVAGDVPAALQGARYDVHGGEVRRVL